MLNFFHLIMLALRGYRVMGTVNGRLKIRTPYYLDDGDQLDVWVWPIVGYPPAVGDLGVALDNLRVRGLSSAQHFIDGAEQFGLTFNRGMLEATIRPGLMLAADIDRFASAVVTIQAVAVMQLPKNKEG